MSGKEKKPEKEKEKKDEDKEITCRECGEKGHLSYNCPKAKCYICGLFCHKSFDCRKRPRGGYGRGGGYRRYGGYDRYGGYRGGYVRYNDSKCYNCGKYGHKSFECNKPAGNYCYICGKPGHISSECSEK